MRLRMQKPQREGSRSAMRPASRAPSGWGPALGNQAMQRLLASRLPAKDGGAGGGGAPAPAPAPAAGAAATESKFAAEGVNVVVRQSCTKNGFSFEIVEAGMRAALDKIFNSDCIEESRRVPMQKNLKKNGYDIRCADSKAIGGNCAESTGFPIPANIMTLGTLALPLGKCGPLGSTILHEIVHVTRGTFPEALPASCEASCFGVGSASPDLCKNIDVFGKRTGGKA